jgi:hypothetical protein
MTAARRRQTPQPPVPEEPQLVAPERERVKAST